MSYIRFSALKQDTEVTGPISVHIWVSCDCRDFDLGAVAGRGARRTAMNLMSPGLDVQRASYRDLNAADSGYHPEKSTN
jgi:hypothetical protein